MIGSISGALVGGLSGEKLGRKKALLIDNIIMVLGNVLYVNKNIFLIINILTILLFKETFVKKIIYFVMSVFQNINKL